MTRKKPLYKSKRMAWKGKTKQRSEKSHMMIAKG